MAPDGGGDLAPDGGGDLAPDGGGDLAPERRGGMDQGARLQHIDGQHGMMGGQGPPRFAHDVGFGHVLVAANFPQNPHHLVGIIPFAIVGAEAMDAARPVIVHAKSPTHVHGIERAAHSSQFHVIAAEFPRRLGHLANIGDLAADMGMEHFQVRQLSRGAQPLHGLHQFPRSQPEL